MAWTVESADRTWSYGGDPMDSLLDMVRFLIGDTDPNFPLISDDEIATCIGTKTDITRMYGPAADACAAIVARFSKYPQTGIAGDVKVDPKEVVAQFLALEKKLRSHDFVIGFGGLVCRRTGQIRRKPFYEGQFDDRSY